MQVRNFPRVKSLQDWREPEMGDIVGPGKCGDRTSNAILDCIPGNERKVGP